MSLNTNRIKFLYIDIMRDIVWPFYHKWILHRGKWSTSIWLTDTHHNPYHILTPRLLERQIEGSKNIEL